MMHLVIFPCAGFSHMRFFVELSKRLPLPDRARITFITSPWMMDSPLSHAILDTLKSNPASANIHFHHLPNVEFTPEQHAQHRNDLETKALSSIVNVYPPIYCVGPLVSDKEGSHKLECTEWLDKQPPGSVLFVSFGSSGSVPKLTLLEMAKGLEKSGHKFIWVVRNTQDGDAFSLDDVSVSGEQGMIVADWAPQQAILSHPSTGGFLSHCGWNSVSESIHMGVPIIPFPLLGDQRFNRILVLEEFRVGVDMKLEEGDAGELLVKAENVQKAVKELMEGEQGKMARERVKELSVLAHRALEGGGSSVCALSKLVSLWSPPMEHSALTHD